jgi:hypothetical protein
VTPLEAATETGAAFSRIATHYMFDPGTYARGAALGLEGIDFYFVGRGGVLGRVDADVVAAAFMFFEPGTVRTAWERGTEVVEPGAAAEEWALAAHDWGEANLPEKVHLARFAELAGRVVDGMHPGGAPIFAGWRRLPRPSSPASLAMHHLNALRELRGAMHVAAVLATGLSALEAVLVKTPYLAPMFGWNEPFPDVGGSSERWQEAEDATNRAIAAAFAALDENELTEFVGLVTDIYAAVPD